MTGAGGGPLAGIRVVEFAGIGPGPFCAMMLADMGAEVIRIDRTGADPEPVPGSQVVNRGRRSVALDLKRPEGRDTALRLLDRADALVEGFRPGVMEKLGLGPEVVLARQPKLVYGRMTGWGQSGPLALAAGHDINYIALSGVLHSIGRPGAPPVPPINLVGDYGGGGMLLAFGIVCGLLEARGSGRGQVVDAAMVEGSALLMSLIYGLRAAGLWSNRAGTNLLDGGAHFYDAYECADGRYVAVGSIEPHFYALLLEKTGLAADPEFSAQMDRSRWPELKRRLADVIRTRSRDQWCELMEGTDVCFAPVLDLDEAPRHPHNRARETFVDLRGVTQPAPAPRFSRTPGRIAGPPPRVGEHSAEVLVDWGFSSAEVEGLRAAGVI